MFYCELFSRILCQLLTQNRQLIELCSVSIVNTEHSSVGRAFDCSGYADIEWSLVRFRVFGFFCTTDISDNSASFPSQDRLRMSCSDSLHSWARAVRHRGPSALLPGISIASVYLFLHATGPHPCRHKPHSPHIAYTNHTTHSCRRITRPRHHRVRRIAGSCGKWFQKTMPLYHIDYL